MVFASLSSINEANLCLGLSVCSFSKYHYVCSACFSNSSPAANSGGLLWAPAGSM